MMKGKCPYCGSGNILPYEEDSEQDHEISLSIIITLGLILIGLYLTVIVTSYLFYPIIVFAGIIVASKFINSKTSGKKKRNDPEKNTLFICLDCNRSFSGKTNR